MANGSTGSVRFCLKLRRPKSVKGLNTDTPRQRLALQPLKAGQTMVPSKSNRANEGENPAHATTGPPKKRSGYGDPNLYPSTCKIDNGPLKTDTMVCRVCSSYGGCQKNLARLANRRPFTTLHVHRTACGWSGESSHVGLCQTRILIQSTVVSLGFPSKPQQKGRSQQNRSHPCPMWLRNNHSCTPR